MPTFEIFHNETDVRSYAAGDVIFSEGQSENGLMYAVIEGEVEIVRHGRVLDSIPPGGVFGEMGLLDKEPRTAAAIAKTECRVAAINEVRFKRLVAINPHFALDMMRLLSERIRRNMAS